MQIYFDFSGYSDMAIGLARMFGFRFPENFNRPYSSISLTDFWRRWHMTLSRWFRDYVYIPLGGNRGTRARTSFNLLFVFLLTGLWHGAAWTFILWGLYNGLILLAERLSGVARWPDARSTRPGAGRSPSCSSCSAGCCFVHQPLARPGVSTRRWFRVHFGALHPALHAALTRRARWPARPRAARRACCRRRWCSAAWCSTDGWSGAPLAARVAAIVLLPARRHQRRRRQLQPLPVLPVLVVSGQTTAHGEVDPTKPSPARSHGVPRMLVAVLAAVFFLTPLVLIAAGVRVSSFENRRLAPAPQVSAGWFFFNDATRYLIDRLPLRRQAVQANTWIDQHVFHVTPFYGQNGLGGVQSDNALPFSGRPQQDRAAVTATTATTSTTGRGSRPDDDRAAPPTASQVTAGRDGWLFLEGTLDRACSPFMAFPAGARRVGAAARPRSGRADAASS